MIRLRPDDEASKNRTFDHRQTIQKSVPESSLVSNACIVPSDTAVLVTIPIKTAAVLQAKKAIDDRFGNANLEP